MNQEAPKVMGWGIDPDTGKILHFTVEGFGERILVHRRGEAWKAGTYRHLEEIAEEAAQRGASDSLEVNYPA